MATVYKLGRRKWSPRPSLVAWLHQLETYRNETLGRK